MATTIEEARAKLSLDVSDVGRARMDIAKFSEGAVERLGHITRESRELHRAFHSLAEIAPALGSAMKLAFSPVAGVIALVGAGIMAVKNSIEAANKEIEKTIGYAGKPTSALNPAEAKRTAAEAVDAVRRKRDERDKPETDPAIKTLEVQKEKIQENARLQKQLADDEHEKAKRRIHDEATARERAYQKLPPGLKRALGQQLEDEKTAADRAADDAHTRATRGIDANARNQQRLAIQAAMKDLSGRREAAFYESNFAEGEALRIAGKAGQRTITAANIAGLESEREKTMKELEEAKVKGFKAVQGSNFWSDLLNQAMGQINPLQWLHPDPELLGLPGDSTKTDKIITDLENKLRDLNRAIEEGKNLNKDRANAEKDSSAAMEEKANILKQLESEYSKLDQELRKLGGPILASTLPILDPATGGIRYRPIKDKGGIAYKGLPNSLDLSGYSSAAMAAQNATQSGPEPIMNVRIVDVKEQ